MCFHARIASLAGIFCVEDPCDLAARRRTYHKQYVTAIFIELAIGEVPSLEPRCEVFLGALCAILKRFFKSGVRLTFV